MGNRPRYCYASGLSLGVPALEELCARGRPPALVVSYPAELAHHSGYIDYEAVTRRHGLEHLRAADLDSDGVRDAITGRGVRLLVAAGWSGPVPRRLLAALPRGGVGLHPTPLPVGRGDSSIPWTILRDMRAGAVTLLHLDGEGDTGDIIDQAWFDIEPDLTATGLYDRVARRQAEVLAARIDDLLAGTAPRRPQRGHVSAWPPLRPSDGRIDFTASGCDVDRLVRALADPYPGAFAMFGDSRITLCAGALAEGLRGGAPGEVVSAGPGRLWGVACGDGTVFVPEAIRVDEGVRADPASLVMFRAGTFFDEPSPHTPGPVRTVTVPGQVPGPDTLLHAGG